MKKKRMSFFLSCVLVGEILFSGGTSLAAQAGEIAVEQEMQEENKGEKYYVGDYNGVKSYFLNPVKSEGKERTVLYAATSNEEIIWNYFKEKGFSDAGTAGIMGNLLAESGYDPTNLENASNMKSGLTDAQFTAQVNNGTVSRSDFISSTKFGLYNYTDSTGTYCTYGYGLAQWTFYSRKAKLYDYWKKSGAASIGDLNMQLDFMYAEMSTSLKNKMVSVSDVSDACVVFHNIYEGSADTAAQIQGRVKNAQNVYNKYVYLTEPCIQGHKWNAWQITKKATYLSVGSKTRTCTVCGEKQTISIAKLCGTSLKSVKNKKDKKAFVSWKKNSKVTGYQIQYSTNPAFKGVKIKNVKGAKKTSYTLSKLKKGKTYYVRVRTYTKKNYSGWSNMKKVKIKK